LGRVVDSYPERTETSLRPETRARAKTDVAAPQFPLNRADGRTDIDAQQQRNLGVSTIVAVGRLGQLSRSPNLVMEAVATWPVTRSRTEGAVRSIPTE